METINKKNEKFITTDELQKQLEAFADELGKAFMETKKKETTTTTNIIIAILLCFGVFNSSGKTEDIIKTKQAYDLPISIPFKPLELSTFC